MSRVPASPSFSSPLSAFGLPAILARHAVGRILLGSVGADATPAFGCLVCGRVTLLAEIGQSPAHAAAALRIDISWVWEHFAHVHGVYLPGSTLALVRKHLAARIN